MLRAYEVVARNTQEPDKGFPPPDLPFSNFWWMLIHQVS
jgi:hypothetical protein